MEWNTLSTPYLYTSQMNLILYWTNFYNNYACQMYDFQVLNFIHLMTLQQPDIEIAPSSKVHVNYGVPGSEHQSSHSESSAWRPKISSKYSSGSKRPFDASYSFQAISENLGHS